MSSRGVYHSDNYIVLDFETTVLDNGSALTPENAIVLAVWKGGPDHPTGMNVKWAGEYDLSDLVEDCRKADYIVAHNAKFELQWLERCGVDLAEAVVFDTMLGDYVLNGNKYVFWNLSLEKVAQRHLNEGKMNIISKFFKAGVCSTEIPASWLEEYCILDVELTERVFLKQRDIMTTELPRLMPVMEHRCALTPVLADLEKQGMAIDGEVVEERSREVTLRLNELRAELEGMTGGINVNSGQQLGPYLYETLGFDELKVKQGGKWVPKRTDTGLYATDADTVLKLTPKNQTQRKFIEMYTEFKALNNEKTKYLDKMLECVRSGDTLIAAFNQTNTQTHRLSSSGKKYKMQFQNFPRSYKPFFRAAEEDWLVAEVDGAQLEFRVAAHMGRDEVAISDIVNGVDVHSVTAEHIGTTRQDAKADTFKPLYGGTSGSDAQKAYYAYFLDRYSGIAAAQQTWIDHVVVHKYLETEWGMRYYWPQCRMEDGGYVSYSTSICNYPVQALATAEIIPAALIYMWREIKRRGLRMRIVNTVHDSIIVELPRDEIDAFYEIARYALIDYIYPWILEQYGVELVVPLGCGIKIATRWSGKDAAEFVPAGLEHKGGEVTFSAEEELYNG